MINLSLDEVRLIAQSRNISDYENKSKEDLIKALSTPKPKPKIIISKKQSEEITKDFNELRQKFSKKEIDRYRKAFYDIKNYKHLSISEIKKASKNLTKLKKSLRFKKFHGNIDSVDYEDLDNYDDMMIIMILPMMMNTEKFGVLEYYLKSLIEIITNQLNLFLKVLNYYIIIFKKQKLEELNHT